MEHKGGTRPRTRLRRLDVRLCHWLEGLQRRRAHTRMRMKFYVQRVTMLCHEKNFKQRTTLICRYVATSWMSTHACIMLEILQQRFFRFIFSSSFCSCCLWSFNQEEDRLLGNYRTLQKETKICKLLIILKTLLFIITSLFQ